MNTVGSPIGTGMSESKTALGKFLREKRLGLHISQVEAAKRVGMKQSRYSTLERGIFTRVNGKWFPGLAHALKCRITELRALTPIRKAPQTKRGNLIRYLRKRQHLSIEELALILHMKRRYVYELETRGNQKMKSETVEKLASALNCDVSIFKNCVGLERRKAKGKLGRLVQSRCHFLNLNQAELARRTGKTRAYISKIESGALSLRFAHETRRLLSGALELDPSVIDAAVKKKKPEVSAIP
ncbi:hypothetical protein A3H65_01565 [Candidatus Giovannonibacteria bacterium RIFCSPLOWO2_02_FULL_45_14]|uniref:HTH cro/C1-type domain-containing protein n=1 Tax=Candidatus Giovannonibacteria bacterium RIFCSPLOWO2_12_FULL_44_15 TaxID=1798364 RepID=A0A1F5XZD2_9BACT|nr:MAG: hypothetical protein A3C75_03465 [Candidatus Giovannonibacteria bacterium RIFCSPHIGHO2_02_FULL_44_31]OGF77079.1 MAG: hypothetical protein A3E62_02645 [Candidatus Giovannonibacteria bacterium RIFCSPHIGHO2_12_FULL_44_29]OGF90832.1 MAG: hypothetical protein A3H65_01565 [Candidatus Giovannonibacteria bacterium RIFCSPLOWO2_02_FULL_45_14]OGF93258.1 MAG: hypothetical protein A3G54_01480 [Candidatus Giovannonibacteria bacterium RIFCSPLOWO2_12_FULL_44_15]